MIGDVTDIASPQVDTTVSGGGFNSLKMEFPWVYGSRSNFLRIFDVQVATRWVSLSGGI